MICLHGLWEIYKRWDLLGHRVAQKMWKGSHAASQEIKCSKHLICLRYTPLQKFGNTCIQCVFFYTWWTLLIFRLIAQLNFCFKVKIIQQCKFCYWFKQIYTLLNGWLPVKMAFSQNANFFYYMQLLQLFSAFTLLHVQLHSFFLFLVRSQTQK